MNIIEQIMANAKENLNSGKLTPAEQKNLEKEYEQTMTMLHGGKLK